MPWLVNWYSIFALLTVYTFEQPWPRKVDKHNRIRQNILFSPQKINSYIHPVRCTTSCKSSSEFTTISSRLSRVTRRIFFPRLEQQKMDQKSGIWEVFFFCSVWNTFQIYVRQMLCSWIMKFRIQVSQLNFLRPKMVIVSLGPQIISIKRIYCVWYASVRAVVTFLHLMPYHVRVRATYEIITWNGLCQVWWLSEGGQGFMCSYRY